MPSPSRRAVARPPPLFFLWRYSFNAPGSQWVLATYHTRLSSSSGSSSGGSSCSGGGSGDVCGSISIHWLLTLFGCAGLSGAKTARERFLAASLTVGTCRVRTCNLRGKGLAFPRSATGLVDLG